MATDREVVDEIHDILLISHCFSIFLPALVKVRSDVVQHIQYAFALNSLVLHLNWLSKAFFVLVLLPFLVLNQLSVELVDVFEELFDELVGGLFLVVGIDFCYNNGDGAVPKL